MQTLITISDRLIRTIHVIAAIMLAIAAALVFYQVITRFVLGDSAVWSEVLARAVIVWGVFLIIGPAIRYGKMIPIDVLRHLVPLRMQIWVIRLVTCAIALFLFILIWFGYKMTTHVVNQNVAMLNVSVAWFYVAIPIGAFLAIPGAFLAHMDAEENNKKMLETSK